MIDDVWPFSDAYTMPEAESSNSETSQATSSEKLPKKPTVFKSFAKNFAELFWDLVGIQSAGNTVTEHVLTVDRKARFLAAALVLLLVCVSAGYVVRGCFDESEIKDSDNNARSNEALSKTLKSQLDTANSSIIQLKVDSNEVRREKDEQIANLLNENNSLKQSISTFQAARVVQLSSNFDNSLTNVLTSALATLTPAKQSFQLFRTSYSDTPQSDTVETNITPMVAGMNIVHIVHNIKMMRTEHRDGIAAGDIIDLKKARDIDLSVIVYGEWPADHLTVKLATPLVEQAQITGDLGWQDLGGGQMLDSSTKSYTAIHTLVLEMGRPIPPDEFIQLPKLHIPTNYPSSSIPIRFKIYSNNAKQQDFGVIFNCE